MIRSTVITVAAFFIAGAALPAQQTASIEQRFAALRGQPSELYAFLYRMPKGADLHNHLSGAIYAESFIHEAAVEKLCVDTAELAIVSRPIASNNCAPPLIDAAKAEADNGIRNSLVDAFSMRDFVPSAGKSGHDHFFDTFAKFGVSSGPFIGEVTARAADQNESYLELMALSGGSFSTLGAGLNLKAGFDSARQQLQVPAFNKSVADARKNADEMDATWMKAVNCTARESCHIDVRYVYQVLRESQPEQIFAQVMGGFAIAAADPRVVAVNFVQAEDGVLSMRDYHLQMQMVEYAHSVYPNVHITLHAGELAPGLVPPEGLRFHIREAVELGHAERIGHGVDIMYEKDPEALMTEMKAKHIAVEINLTSNDGILGVTGDRHPFPVYRKNGVPVLLSTDDEGVSRSQLTLEFQRAVETYHLSYADLKQLVRNSIEYSFAPGKSYWRSGTFAAPVAACSAGTKSAACKTFLDQNEKARLEADLETRFVAFEKNSH